MLSGELSKQTTLTLRLIEREFLGGISLEDYLALHIVFSKCKVIYFSKSKTRMNIFWQRCVCVFSMDYPTIYIYMLHCLFIEVYYVIFYIYIFIFVGQRFLLVPSTLGHCTVCHCKTLQAMARLEFCVPNHCLNIGTVSELYFT